MEWEDGNEYPVIRLDVSSDSHPFYTGRQKFAAADGRVERFNKSLDSNQTTTNFGFQLSTFPFGYCRQFLYRVLLNHQLYIKALYIYKIYD